MTNQKSVVVTGASTGIGVGYLEGAPGEEF